jgi:hypothetical protein
MLFGWKEAIHGDATKFVMGVVSVTMHPLQFFLLELL